MSGPNSSHPRLDALLTALEQGELSVEQRAELNDLLRSDPQARDRYLAQVEIGALLRTRFSQPLGPLPPELLPADHPAEQADLPRVTPAPLGDSHGRRQYWHRHPVTFVAAVSALTLLLAVGFFSIWRGPFEGPFLARPGGADPEGAGAVEAGEIVATIARAFQPIFDKRSNTDGQIRSLRAGQRIVLASGVVELAFVDGTQVMLQGPASYLIEDVGRTRLDGGRLLARVTHDEGFTVTTPTARIIDRGTEFGVLVDNGGRRTEIHVSEGAVEAAPATGRYPLRRLVAGQALSIQRSSQSSSQFVLQEKKMNKATFLALATVLAAAPTQAGVIALYDFEAAPGGNSGGNTFDDTDLALFSVDTDADTAAQRLQSSGVDGGGSGNIFGQQFGAASASGAPNTNFGNADTVTPTNYFSFRITPGASKSVTYESISFYYGTHNNGAGEFNISYVDDPDNGGSEVFITTPSRSNGVNLYSMDFADFASSNVVEWRIYIFGSTSNTVGNRFDDITLNADVTAVPEPGAIGLLGSGAALLCSGGLMVLSRRRRRQ